MLRAFASAISCVNSVGNGSVSACATVARAGAIPTAARPVTSLRGCLKICFMYDILSFLYHYYITNWGGGARQKSLRMVSSSAKQLRTDHPVGSIFTFGTATGSQLKGYRSSSVFRIHHRRIVGW